MATVDINAEREKIKREIEVLEKSLRPGGTNVEITISDTEADISGEGTEDDESDEQLQSRTEAEEGEGEDEDGQELNFTDDPETCLQMNLVYQEVIQEKLHELINLLTQNKEQQEELMWELAGQRNSKPQKDKSCPANVYVGHFLKPYFKDKATGLGPPANEETRDKMAQGIKSFEELVVIKWKAREKVKLKQALISSSLQRLLQPKLLRLGYLHQKLSKCKDETEVQLLEKQIRENDQEVEEINHLPADDLLGDRFYEHDWDKVANIDFEGARTPKEIKKLWQQFEHPSINKDSWSEEEIEKLKDIAAEHNFVNWESIAHQLGTNRTAFMCLQKFQAFNRELRRKEWTKEEDKLLKELVETMRIGRHIPYRRIAYYMEGRDSAQILTRWTQSLDPSLKRGPWSPKEDEMLLKAVAKYGVGDWYKIRKEVPGRSDAQCRERYLRGLDESLKKGKWSEEEEKMLLQSIEKYGVGHWSRIASELPHRTGSQCLSKWKIMIGLKRRTGPRNKSKPRRLLKRNIDSESSSSLSSTESEESEMTFSSSSEEKEEEEELLEELEEEEEEEPSPKKKLRDSSYTIPHIDLWIPTEEIIGFRKTPTTCFGAKNHSLSVKYSEENIRHLVQKEPKQLKTASASPNSATPRTFPSDINTVLRGVGYPPNTDICTSDPTLLLWEAYRSGKYVIALSMLEVRRIIRCNTSHRLSKIREQIKKTQASRSTLPSEIRPAESVNKEQVQERSKPKCLIKMRRNLLSPYASEEFLNRKLLLAVVPWVGNVFLPCTVAGRRTSVEANNVRRQFETIGLTSTPVFTLLIQFFQIDTDGCMKVIQERKISQLENARNVTAPLPVTYGSSGLGPQLYFQSIIAAEQCTSQNSNMKDNMPNLGSENLNCFTSLTFPPLLMQPQPPIYGQKPKLKTVSELLKEMRMREARTKEQLKNAVYPAPEMVVARPVVVQQPLHHSAPSAQSLPAQQTQVASHVPSAAVPSTASVPVSIPAVTVATVPETSSSGTQGSRVSETTTGSGNEALKHENASASSSSQNEEQRITNRASVIVPTHCDNPVQFQLSKDHPQMFSSQNLTHPGSNTCKTQGILALPPFSHPVQQNVSQQKASPKVLYQGVPPLVANKILPLKWVVMPQCIPALPVQTVGLRNQNIVQQNSTASHTTRSCDTQSVVNSSVTLPVAQTLPQPQIGIANSVTLPAVGKTACLKETPSLIQLDSGMACASSSLKTTILPSIVNTDNARATNNSISIVGLSNKVSEKLSENDEEVSSAELLRKDSSVRVQGMNSGVSIYPASQSSIIYLTAPNATSLTPSVQNATHLGHLGQQVIQMTVPSNVVSIAKQISQPVIQTSVEPAGSSSSTPTVTAQPKASTAQPDKNLLDLSLMFLEEQPVIKEWLKGKEGVQLPMVINSMPYLPPSVCSLKILARLLLQKKSLEENFSELSIFKMNEGRSSDKPTDLVRDLVQQKLKDNPAYLLLKQRFLSAFTFPAFLSIFAPSRVNTTVSRSSDRLASLEDSEDEDYDYDEILQTYRRLSMSKYDRDHGDEHLQNGDIMSTDNNASVQQSQPAEHFPEFRKEMQDGDGTDTDASSGQNASSLTTGFIKARSMRLRKRVRKF
ncbi:snRNA-activating protein complex subunit 4 [Protopterus annectens]|uniref:snRNA-activating protein complex subunit 4 n=1 Tax=Protopterus annectens TaxID=7888 RepID=UPI001CFA483C|nr:snRNA-activating protein complex subunit 4 [Protopterus annectens]